MNYDEIRLEIFERAEAGDITSEERDALFEKLDDAYVDSLVREYEETETDGEDEDSITLEEAMDTIEEYLESTAMQRNVEKTKNEISKIEDEKTKIVAKYNKLIGDSYDDKEIKRLKDIRDKKIKKLNDDKKALSEKLDKFEVFLPSLEKNKKDGYLGTSVTPVDTKNMKRYNKEQRQRIKKSTNAKFKKNAIDPLENRKPGRFAKESVEESVSDLRLRVFEAFEEGAIDKEEKDMFLEYLDLENYE